MVGLQSQPIDNSLNPGRLMDVPFGDSAVKAILRLGRRGQVTVVRYSTASLGKLTTESST